jgi:hypothetical protein
MFRDAKVGDRVWTVEWGWGTIIETHYAKNYPVKVKFDRTSNDGSFTSDGRWRDDAVAPSLFWNEVKIIPPPRPKRKVKRVVEGWMCLYNGLSGDDIVAGTTHLYTTKEGALKGAGCSSFCGGRPVLVFVRHEYEVEE